MQLQKDSEESSPHSPCILIQCQDLKTISSFCPSVRESTSSLVSVQSFHLMIKETEKKGQCVHHILAEELRASQRIWNYLTFLLSAALSSKLQLESPKFYSKILHFMY